MTTVNCSAAAARPTTRTATRGRQARPVRSSTTPGTGWSPSRTASARCWPRTPTTCARRRIKETAGTATTDVYFTPGWQVLEERAGGTAAANVVAQYVLGADGRVVLRDSYAAGAVVAASRLYAQQDANGDIIARWAGRGDGAVQERYWYEPYGAVHVLAGTASPGPPGAATAGGPCSRGAASTPRRASTSSGSATTTRRPASGWVARPDRAGGRRSELYRFVGNSP